MKTLKGFLIRLSWRVETGCRRRPSLSCFIVALFVFQMFIVVTIIGTTLLNGKQLSDLDYQFGYWYYDTDNMSTHGHKFHNSISMNNRSGLNLFVSDFNKSNLLYIKKLKHPDKDAKEVKSIINHNLSVNTLPGGANNNNPTHYNSLTKNNLTFYKFINYSLTNPSKFILVDDTAKYFQAMKNGKMCYIKGTHMKISNKSKKKHCICKMGYHADDCGIPDAIWYGLYENLYPHTKLRRRTTPRRIINGFPVHHEFAMFEARLYELYDIIDVFLIVESNYSSHRDPKELEFYNKLKGGYLQEFQDKLHYLFLDFLYKYGKEDGWATDQFIRYYLGKRGLDLLQGVKNDDIFILSDSDEIPTREVVTFLKLYDGYSEPIAFAYRWNVFGFFWKYPPDDDYMNWLFYHIEEKTSIVYSAATIGLLKEVLLGNLFFIRKENAWTSRIFHENLKKYRNNGGNVKSWVAGDIGHYAGWHCSWCFNPVDIIKKLDAAQADDVPRWGDYPEKRNISYIAEIISDGRWFDDTTRFLPCNTTDAMYAPQYFLKYPEKYKYLLYHS